MGKRRYVSICLLLTLGKALGQSRGEPLKLKHAEPLYVDLIRDLGARKGEKEVNVGLSYGDAQKYNRMGGFLEYEFAVANRWGMEVEADFSFYHEKIENDSQTPHSRFDGLKWANQFTFLVSNKWQTSMAIAFIHEFRFHSFYTIQHLHHIGNGTTENPVIIVAKRWGKRLHTMMYTGPEWHFTPGDKNDQFGYQMHTSLHYVSQKGHFVGMECNQEHVNGKWYCVLHPQIKWKLDNRMAFGFITGVPISGEREKVSFMTRLILEL